MNINEQICKRRHYPSRSLARFLKRQTVKWHRRLAKRLLGDAPKKARYRGYSD